MWMEGVVGMGGHYLWQCSAGTVQSCKSSKLHLIALWTRSFSIAGHHQTQYTQTHTNTPRESSTFPKCMICCFSSLFSHLHCCFNFTSTQPSLLLWWMKVVVIELNWEWCLNSMFMLVYYVWMKVFWITKQE